MVNAEDIEKLIVGIEPEYMPGEHWQTSGEALQLLGLVLEKAADMELQKLAQDYLFEPLGLLSANLDENAKGQALVYYQYYINPLDWAKLGLLVLSKGLWQGKRIISSEYIEAMTQPAQELNPNYYLAWYKFHQPPGLGDILFAGSYMALYPDLELVAVRMTARGSGRAMDSSEPNKAAGYFTSLFKQ